MTTEGSSAGDAIVAAATDWEAAPPADVATAVQNLMQAYAMFADSGLAGHLAALFTADATWDGSELDYGTATGPAAIAANVVRHFDPAQPMVHVPGPALLVARGPDELEAASWCIATRATDGPGTLIFFHYHDVLRREPDGWRFASRLLSRRLLSR